MSQPLNTELAAPVIQVDISPPPANHLLIKSKHLRGGFAGKFLVIVRTERLPRSSKYQQNKHFLNVIHVCSWPDQGRKITNGENSTEEIIHNAFLRKVRCNEMKSQLLETNSLEHHCYDVRKAG